MPRASLTALTQLAGTDRADAGATKAPSASLTLGTFSLGSSAAPDRRGEKEA